MGATNEQIQKARDLGYSDEQINNYLNSLNKQSEDTTIEDTTIEDTTIEDTTIEESSVLTEKIQKARDLGYSDEQINIYLNSLDEKSQQQLNQPSQEEGSDPSKAFTGVEKEYDTSIIRKYGADPLLSFAKGITQLPDIVSGVVDTAGAFIPGNQYSLGRGFDRFEKILPEWMQDVGENLESFKSQELKDKKAAAQEEIKEAEGFVDTAKTTIGTMLENPSLLFDSLIESLPSTITGGKIAQTALRAKKFGLSKLTNPIAAGAIGEGIVSEGQTAESIRAQTEEGILSAKQAGISGLSGILTSTFGVFGGKLNKHFDAFDFDTYLAGGLNRKLGKDVAADLTNIQFLKRKATDIFKAAIIEGTAEELPQSMQEQMAQNIALGKDPMEGVAEAGASGFLLGFTMGGGGAMLSGGAGYNQKVPKIEPESNTEYNDSNETPINEIIGAPVEEAQTEEDLQIDMFETTPEIMDFIDDKGEVKKIKGIADLEYEFLKRAPFKSREAAQRYLNQYKYNSKTNTLEFNKTGYKGDLNSIFEIVETEKIVRTKKEKQKGLRGKVQKVYEFRRRPGGGGGSGDEDTLTLEQKKFLRQTESNLFPGEQFEPDFNTGLDEFDSKGNRVRNVVPRKLVRPDTDTKTPTKIKGKGVGEPTDTLAGTDAGKADSTPTLEFIDKTNDKSPLRNKAITKVLTDNPGILETAMEEETTINDTGLTPNQYKKEYAEWENAQKQDKESWKKRKRNKKQLTKDFESSLTTPQKTQYNQLAEGLAPLKTENKVLDIAIREVVAKEYSKYTKSKRDKRLKKYKDAAEKKLEKEYQRVNNAHKKKNKDAKDLTASEAARAANNKKLGDRKTTKNKDGTIKNVTYFTGAKPQEFIKDNISEKEYQRINEQHKKKNNTKKDISRAAVAKTIVEEINRETFSQDNYKNFRKALENAGKLEQYNNEVANIIASPPLAENVNLPSEPGEAVQDKYKFTTEKARDEFIKNANEGKPVVDNKGKVSEDFVVPKGKELVPVKLPGNVKEPFTVRVQDIPEAPTYGRDIETTRQEKIETTQKEIKSATPSIESVVTTVAEEQENLADSQIYADLGQLITSLIETIGKDGASITEVLNILKQNADMQAVTATTDIRKLGETKFQFNNISDIFLQLLNDPNFEEKGKSIFGDMKVKNKDGLGDMGEYNPNTNTITLDLNAIRQTNAGKVGSVVIHELVHGLLDRVLLPQNFKKLTPSMQEAVTEIKTQYKNFKDLKKKQPNPVFNRARNLKEFVAMMFESSELAKAIEESARKEQIERAELERIMGIGTGKLKRTKELSEYTENEFDDYINSITGTTPVVGAKEFLEKSIVERTFNIINNFFQQVMRALGVAQYGSNEIVQEVIVNSLSVLLDPAYLKTSKSLSPGGISNWGKDKKGAAETETSKEIEVYKEKNKDKKAWYNRTISQVATRLTEVYQDVHVKLKDFDRQNQFLKLYKDAPGITNAIGHAQSLVQGKASIIYKEMLLPFTNNMFKALRNFSSIVGLDEKDSTAMINMYYEALGEYTRSSWLFSILMPLSMKAADKFTIPKWKDETGKIISITVTPYEFREKILERIYKAEADVAINQGSTNEIEKLRNMLQTFVEQQRIIAVNMLAKGVEPFWQHNIDRAKKITSQSPEGTAPYNRDSIMYSSGELGVSEKIASQVKAKELLKRMGLNYDLNLTKMTAEQIAEGQKSGEILPTPTIDAFILLADRISELADATKAVNKKNGYVVPQGNNIIRLMGFKYYKPLKRQQGKKDSSVHKERDIEFMYAQDNASSKELNQVEALFGGGQQEAVGDVVAQMTADGIKAAMRTGYQGYTQAIANAAQETYETTINDKTVSKPLAPFLKFKKTLGFDDRYNVEKLELKDELGRQKIVLNFRLDGKIDVIEIIDDNYIVPIKGQMKEINKLLRYLGKGTSAIGQVHTRFSIPFGLTNFQRDFFTNIPLLLIKHPGALMPYLTSIFNQVFKANFITTWRYVRMNNRDDTEAMRRGLAQAKKGSYEYNVADYLLRGGQISYVRGVSSASAHEHLTKDIVTKESLLNTALLTRFFDAWIGTFEIAVRASAYRAILPSTLENSLKASGNPKEGTKEYDAVVFGASETAAAEVKNFANFESAGERSAEVAAWYMFFKPSMTSAAINLKAVSPAWYSESAFLDTLNPDMVKNPELKDNALAEFNSQRKRAQAVIIGGGALGVALWFVLGALGEEEEEDEKGKLTRKENKLKTDDMERWVRNIRLPIKWLPEKIKDKLGIDKNQNIIQMHWGFGNMGWPAMGVQIAAFWDIQRNNKNIDNLPTDFEFMELFSNITAIAMDNFLPLPISRSKISDDPVFFFLDSVAPSVIKPLLELTANTNTFGYQITRQRLTTVGGAYGSRMSTDDLYRDFAEFINRASGRNIDLDPNILKFFADSYIDGFAKIISAIAQKGDIIDLETAKNKTLIFKQFIAKHTSPDMKRYNKLSKKVEKIKRMEKQGEFDKYTDFRGRDFYDIAAENTHLSRIKDVWDAHNTYLKTLYENQKIYQRGKDLDGSSFDTYERKEAILNIKLEINAVMRKALTQIRGMDGADELGITEGWASKHIFSDRTKEELRNIGISED